SLHGAVAPPDHDQVRTFLEGELRALRGLAALGDLVPDWVGDPFECERAPQLGEPAADRLAGVCDHGNRAHRVTSPLTRTRSSVVSLQTACSSRITIAVRMASDATINAPAPTITLANTSVTWCMPAYTRE